MIKGIHTSAMAMRQNVVRQDLTANNLANADTVGYKRDRLFASDLLAAQDAGAADLSKPNAGRFTDMSSGAYQPTGADLDFAIQGEGFFVVSDGSKDLFTRNGHFLRTSEGALVDNLGRKLQGEGGEITLPTGVVNLSPDGEISVNGTTVDRLKIVKFEDTAQLSKEEGSAFSALNGAAPVPRENPAIRQGFLESSNVDTVREMVEMIATARSYEINAKLVAAQDDSLRHSVGELGRV